MTVGEFIRTNKNRKVFEKTNTYIDITIRNSKYHVLAYLKQDDGLKVSREIEELQIANWYVAFDPRDVDCVQIWIMVKDQ